MKSRFARFVTIGILCGPFLAAQPADTTQLKQIIIFGRHAVRTPVATNTDLDHLSALAISCFRPLQAKPP